MEQEDRWRTRLAFSADPGTSTPGGRAPAGAPTHRRSGRNNNINALADFWNSFLDTPGGSHVGPDEDRAGRTTRHDAPQQRGAAGSSRQQQAAAGPILVGRAPGSGLLDELPHQSNAALQVRLV